mmetsp:Transcript_149261/g.271697  ORF Transcript_149261/g.271697 Transcript_149261/m.271697 type:complete len:315 (+) Transcript_149261:2202-3146(+)
MSPASIRLFNCSPIWILILSRLTSRQGYTQPVTSRLQTWPWSACILTRSSLVFTHHLNNCVCLSSTPCTKWTMSMLKGKKRKRIHSMPRGTSPPKRISHTWPQSPTGQKSLSTKRSRRNLHQLRPLQQHQRPQRLMKRRPLRRLRRLPQHRRWRTRMSRLRRLQHLLHLLHLLQQLLRQLNMRAHQLLLCQLLLRQLRLRRSHRLHRRPLQKPPRQHQQKNQHQHQPQQQRKPRKQVQHHQRQHHQRQRQPKHRHQLRHRLRQRHKKLKKRHPKSSRPQPLCLSAHPHHQKRERRALLTEVLLQSNLWRCYWLL